MSELFDAVDALLASRATLPPPAERKRLRAAHGLTIDEVAKALGVRRATVSGWESGKTEPRPPERDAYARLLDKLAELYPAAPADGAVPAPDAAVPATFTAAPAPAEAQSASPGPASEAAVMTAPEDTQAAPAPAPVAAASGGRAASGARRQADVDVAAAGREEGGPGRDGGERGGPAVRERAAGGRRR